MKHCILVPVLALIMFAIGCGEKQQVKVTYVSDPPGGTLYKEDGEMWGTCPKVLWYNLDREAIKNGYLDAKGLIVRWPSGPERRSYGPIPITVDGTNRKVIFTQPTHVKVLFRSDPPGGILCTQNGEVCGPCPKALWYDLDEEAIENGYLDAKGFIVRWPSGLEKRSGDLIRITVDGTDREVTFTQTRATATTRGGESLPLTPPWRP